MLSNYSVWLIDDAIPIHKLANDFPKREDVISGRRPIDHGLLCHLLLTVDKSEWAEDVVYELCKQLVNNVVKLDVFRHPQNALSYLALQESLPDIVIYDLEYKGTQQSNVDELLCSILSHSFCLAQVYTTDAISLARNKLVEAYKRFSPQRLSEPENKSGCDATKLANLLQIKLNNSFSARMAKSIRKSSIIAIEKTLIDLDDLPIKDAISVLIGKSEQSDRPGEQDFVDFVGNKVADALANDQSLDTVLHKYIKGVLGETSPTEEQLKTATAQLTNIIASAVREQVQHGGEVFNIIQATITEVAKQKPVPNDAEQAGSPLTRFTHSWMYSHPNDEIARTGDIIYLGESPLESALPSSLYFVLTPPCDIQRFWKKTRGILTLAVLEPVQGGQARETLHRHNPSKQQFKQPITGIDGGGAQGPVLLPALILATDKVFDYVLFSHNIESRIFAPPHDSEIGKVLTYSVLKSVTGNSYIQRVAKLSEPFLTGVLEHIASSIFQTGLPDIPEFEIHRANRAIKETNK